MKWTWKLEVLIPINHDLLKVGSQIRPQVGRCCLGRCCTWSQAEENESLVQAHKPHCRFQIANGLRRQDRFLFILLQSSLWHTPCGWQSLEIWKQSCYGLQLLEKWGLFSSPWCSNHFSVMWRWKGSEILWDLVLASWKWSHPKGSLLDVKFNWATIVNIENWQHCKSIDDQGCTSTLLVFQTAWQTIDV